MQSKFAKRQPSMDELLASLEAEGDLDLKTKKAKFLAKWAESRDSYTKFELK